MQLLSFEIDNKKYYTLEYNGKLSTTIKKSILLLALSLTENTVFSISSKEFFNCSNVKLVKVLKSFTDVKSFLHQYKDSLMLYSILSSFCKFEIKTITDCGHRINVVSVDNCVSSYTKNELLKLCFSSYQ